MNKNGRTGCGCSCSPLKRPGHALISNLCCSTPPISCLLTSLTRATCAVLCLSHYFAMPAVRYGQEWSRMVAGLHVPTQNICGGTQHCRSVCVLLEGVCLPRSTADCHGLVGERIPLGCMGCAIGTIWPALAGMLHCNHADWPSTFGCGRQLLSDGSTGCMFMCCTFTAVGVRQLPFLSPRCFLASTVWVLAWISARLYWHE